MTKPNRESQAILPVCFLVKGQSCLVVGGGKIAARKAGHLLDAEACVTVVCPEAGDELLKLAESGLLNHVARDFEDADVDDKRLVFAATDNEAVNRRVLDCCRERGILCSAVDSNWTSSDFVTPAICRKKGLVVSVSTGGRSCTRARIVKERMAEFIDTLVDDD
ncbi:MAG: bifunctional precorrin-2 dehydrogenase/sirohydrochlorin ferrochelatase [Kiritimatiellia bacterium]|jgi:siroheme synthase-like protein|nr:bifunctional precorrin-2 dehydrogenase/sirohydrochlorin ferrochelatase [Kiritimatiellia bacterium]MDP6847363.1 bifunctional precorrin-2 dehydrogenase/sirohydrochlorin ferrochelatase [Kiritimatiellia bacterium]